jgi:transcriptional regulator with XRE-family HTH domain
MGRRLRPLDGQYANSPLAEYLNGLCRERGLSLRSASLAAGLGEATLGNIVRGYRRPDPATIKKIATYFNISEDALLEMAGHRTVNYNGQLNEITDPELRLYLAPEKINRLSSRDLAFLKATLRHLLQE